MGGKTMKKGILTLAAIVALGQYGIAQDTDSPGFKLGIKVAPNLGWIKSDTKEVEGNGMAVGFTFGLMGDFRLGKDNYALSTGVFLNLSGGNQVAKPGSLGTETTGDNPTGVKLNYPAWEFARRYQYVEIPILIKLKTNEMGYMTYFGQLGFGSAFNISAKSDEYTFTTTTPDGFNYSEFVQEEKAKHSDETSPFRASLIVGAGAEYKFAGNTAMVFGVNYNNGFTDVFEGPAVRFRRTGSGKVETHGKLHYLELLLGIYF
ncbi:MAG: PorT family protein [Flavobacteriales bacterium]|nr:PorT family protein [Flavobacteriales bacterium]